MHRDNLGDTGSNGGIMHREGLSPATLQVAPQLAQQLVKEQALAQRLQQQNVPRAAPPAWGPGPVPMSARSRAVPMAAMEPAGAIRSR